MQISDAIAPAPGFITAIAAKYEAWKIAFGDWALIGDRELHIHLGLLVFFLTAVITRRSLRSPWPLAATIIVEAVNEYLGAVATGSWDWPDTRVDILYTLFWPLLLFLLVRSRLIKSG
jgi:hypothetical protein